MNYDALRKWNKDLGSYPYYISDQLKKAAKDKAPQDAIYKRDHIGGDDVWVTVRDLAPDHDFRVWYEESGA